VIATASVLGLPVQWEGVRFAYAGEDVLHGISLAIGAGESVALLGHNGAGKTTLTRMLMGLIRPREGAVSVGDWAVATRRPHQMASRVGYAFQHADQQLFARTVTDDVAFGPSRLGIGTAHVPGVLAELGLAEVVGRHPYDLPAPLRKLVSVAGVLAMRTGVLVLDEPTAGFDSELRSRVVAALKRRRADGVTVICVSHDLAFVRAVATREVTLDHGRVTSDDPVTPSP
jgi:energy-coupling factor transport system ATP-binding protein